MRRIESDGPEASTVAAFIYEKRVADAGVGVVRETSPAGKQIVGQIRGKPVLKGMQGEVQEKGSEY